MPAFEGCLVITAANVISLPERDLSEPVLGEKGRYEYNEVDDDGSLISDCRDDIDLQMGSARNPSLISDLELCKDLLETARKTLNRFWQKAPKSFWDAREDGLNEDAETPSP